MITVKQKPLVVINGEAVREAASCDLWGGQSTSNWPNLQPMMNASGFPCNQFKWCHLFSNLRVCVTIDSMEYWINSIDSILHSFIHVAAPVIHYSWWWWWWRWWWQSFPACTANLPISSQSASRLHHQPMMAMNDYEWIGSFSTKHIVFVQYY